MTHNIYILFYVLLIFDYYANIQDIIFYLRGVFQVDCSLLDVILFLNSLENWKVCLLLNGQ